MTKLKTTLFFILFSVYIQAQIIVIQDSVLKPKYKLSFLDSLKTTYVVDDMSACVDSLWLKNIATETEYSTIKNDIATLNLNEKVTYDLPTDVLKERLKRLDEKSPFNIEYNEQLENLIKMFLKTRKSSFERLMGVSQYYFPMFEEALARYNVPLEIKYLAIVESALNPLAVSRVGATGLWQFMFETGKQYKLNINSYVDERRDPLKASDAAARYMEGMFKIFGDWELVLASYNSGAGNVSKAIRRSGGHQNFWNIKKNLPRETQGYVPAFLATMYIFEYHKEHGIVPNKAIANHIKTDTIAVKNKISFKQLSDLLDISENEITFLNPSYKNKVVPYITGEKNVVRLPLEKVAIFTANEDKMYAYIDYLEKNREKQFITKPKVKIIADTTNTALTEIKLEKKPIDTEDKSIKIKIYKVKKGDNLNEIATLYNVLLTDLKNWNNLKRNKVNVGTRLKIKLDKDAIATTEKTKKVETNIAKIDTEKQKEYIVKTGDNLTKIAKENKLFVADLKKWNNLTENQVKVGDKLCLQAPTETKNYTVKKGDNLAKIAKEFNTTIAEIQKTNNLPNSQVKVGEELKIETTNFSTEIAEKTKKPSKLSEFKKYIVQKGDSLFSISLKHNTTIANIKKLNNMENENIQPGMELKI